jgi:large subunit ribosomal protein L7/L12
MASEKSLQILETIKSLTILELADLVKAVEEEFGVSAAAPVAVAAQQVQQLPQQKKRPNST